MVFLSNERQKLRENGTNPAKIVRTVENNYKKNINLHYNARQRILAYSCHLKRTNKKNLRRRYVFWIFFTNQNNNLYINLNEILLLPKTKYNIKN